jgi:cell division protein FtsZ
MGEDILDFGLIEDKMQGIIKVIGVGGGGCNAVRNMYDEDISGVTLAVCNTDSKSLAPSPVPTKILLGEGLGAGGKPEIGRSEAEKNIDDIERLLSDGTKMVFITASMGGGTGTGSAPVVASVAKKMGMLTIGIVTIPFYFEKKQKIIRALKAVDEMRKNVDAILIINNERLCDVYADTPISVKESFARADKILKDAVTGISELITVNCNGGIDLDFRDLESTMRDGGGAIMAMGRASGEKRVERAIKNALNSPLLYGSDISHAKRILFNIYSSDEAPIMVPEMQEIDEFFDSLNPNIEVIWGISSDNTIGEDAKVTILATGMEESYQKVDDDQKDDDYYESLISQLYKPIQKPVEEPAQDPYFVVEPAPDPEPYIKEKPARHRPTLLNKCMNWFKTFAQDTEE